MVKRRAQEELEKMVEKSKKEAQRRTQSEKALRASEKNYREIFNASQDALLIHDPKTGSIVDANQRACEMLKYSREELIKSSIGSLSSGESPYTYEEALKRIHKTSSEGSQTFEWSAKDSENKSFWVEVNLKRCVIRGNDRILAVVRDITDRKKAEDKLKNDLFQQKAILDNIPDIAWLKDKEGRFIAVNEPFGKSCGYKPEEIVGKTDLDIWPRDLAERYQADDRKVIESGKRKSVEEPLADKEGGIIYIETIRTPIFNDKGGIMGTACIARNINDRKRAEQVLKDREEELATIYDNAPLIMLLVDENWTIRKTNAFTAQFVGTTIGNMVNRRCGEALRCIHALDNPEGCGFGPSCKECALRLTILNTIETGRGHLAEKLNMSFSDEENVRAATFLISTTKLLIREQPLAIVSMQNITERKQTEQQMLSLQEQLQQSQKMEAIGRLAGGVAHDFNNLLTVISIQSQLALRELQEGNPLREKLKDIEQAADRAANLTRQLLAFSRRQILEMKVINLNFILNDLEKMLRRVIGEHIEVKTLFADNLGLVKVDPGQMEQVLMNLVVNAKDSMPQGGKLFLETANAELDEECARPHVGLFPGAYVVLSVTDTGIGITKEVREHIFDPFFTTKGKGKGTGLGLSTVYGIVKQSGGEIYVYSEVDKGTTFKVYLPRVFEPLEELKKEVPVDKIPQGNETVLVVEDDDSVRKLVLDILRMQGYKVLEAAEAEEALIICEKEKNPIHLILTDIVMPKMNGPQLIERLKQVRRDFKALYMSGYADGTVFHYRLLGKGVTIINKPFTVEKLTRKVREVLDEN